MSFSARARISFREGSFLHQEQRELHVLPGGEHGDQVEGLEDEPDGVQAKVGEPAVRVGGHVLVVDLHQPLGGVVDAPDDVQERRLAASRRPDDGDEIPFPDGQVNAPQRMHGRCSQGIVLLHVLQLDHVHGEISLLGEMSNLCVNGLLTRQAAHSYASSGRCFQSGTQWLTMDTGFLSIAVCGHPLLTP